MKTLLGLWMVVIPAMLASAQENDDLYFRSKDRQKAASASADSYVSNYDAFKRQHFLETDKQESNVNPTDSYAARQVNPEYVARANAEQASTDEQNYFVEGYTPVSPAGTGYNSNFFNNNWNNPWYTGWYGPARFNNWYAPYYGFYDPWMNPFWGYGPGWYSGFGSYWSPWGNSWSMMIGYSWGNTWGNTWGNPWCNTLWGPSWSYWNNAYYYYGSNERTRVNYGKRPSGNTVVAGDVRNHYRDNSRNQALNNTSGRTRGDDNYYVRPSRRGTTGSTTTHSTETGTPTRSYSRDTHISPTQNRNNTFRDSRPSYTPSRSSSFPSGGSRSAPSSGSRSRGRD